MMLFKDKDLGWGGLAGAMALMFVVSSALKGPLPGGAFSERLPLLLQYVGQFLAAALFGGFIVALLWVFHRVKARPYATPRRDFAIALLLMTIVTWKPAQATLPSIAPVAALPAPNATSP